MSIHHFHRSMNTDSNLGPDLALLRCLRRPETGHALRTCDTTETWQSWLG